MPGPDKVTPGSLEAEFVALEALFKLIPGTSVPRLMAEFLVRPFAGALLPEPKERQLIELTLELANASDQYDAQRAVDGFIGWYGATVGSRLDDESDEEWALRQPEQVASRARRRLALIAKERALDGSRHAESVRAELVAASPAILLQAQIGRDASGELVHYALLLASLATAVDYALALLLMRNRPYYMEIRQCALESCGRFFLSSRVGKGKGKKPFKFCPGRNCKDRYHSRTGPERTRKSRAKSHPEARGKRTIRREPK
jgi:hypothetical protein